MKLQFENGLFIFRRDFRIVDNNGLNLLNEKCKNIYTVFIFTPEQVGSNNEYKSDNSLQFMIESLQDLEKKIKIAGGHLYTFYGDNEKVITNCISKFNIDVVCYNIDYSPYAKERDAKIVNLCEKMQTYVMYDYDYYLHTPDQIVSGIGKPYVKFTPYYEAALKIKVDQPNQMRILRLTSLKNKKIQTHLTSEISLDKAMNKFTKINSDILVRGGRDEAIRLLRKAITSQKHYSKTHNHLSENTSLLSAYIKFGCLSIREIYKSFRHNRDFIRQLFWRDFYGQILYNNPKVLGYAMKPSYSKIKWHHNEKWLNAWKNGITGFPIVDAGMRQLNTTGYCHNRARLIVASFLIKTLLIDWRKGEKIFAEKLTDYDPASNNGNWQWCASTGADSQPYFRIFNPWLQQEEHDPDCEYIKKWVPELAELEPKIIHTWYKEWGSHKEVKYNKPICNYEEQKEKALQMYKAIF